MSGEPTVADMAEGLGRLTAALAAEKAKVARLPSTDHEWFVVRQRLLDYWWQHGFQWDRMNLAPMLQGVIHDLRLVLAAPCPSNPSATCTVDHQAALAETADTAEAADGG